MAQVVKAVNVDKAMGKLLADFFKKNQKVVGTKVADMPRRFLREAYSFYPQVLRVRTGRLRKSFQQFSHKKGDIFAVGLKSDVEYAHVQHEGFNGTVNVKAHSREGSSVRAHTRKMKIKKKEFFSKPIGTIAENVITELKKELGF